MYMSQRMLVLVLCGWVFMIARDLRAQTMTTPTPRTIAVSGQAERLVSPDVAVIVLAVQTQAETVAKAVTANNDLANRVTGAVKALNIAGLTMRTTSFNVEPLYEQFTQPPTPPRSPRIVGYQVVNQLQFRVLNTDTPQLSADAGRVLDAGLGAGANRIDSLQFTLNDERPILRALQGEATRDATANAKAIAAAAGVTLGPLMSISATPYFNPPPGPVFARAASSDEAAGVPIIAGQLTIRATVQAVYGIGNNG